jgi:hypothetical protein
MGKNNSIRQIISEIGKNPPVFFLPVIGSEAAKTQLPAFVFH